MSDTRAPAFDYCFGPKQEETLEFSTYRWQEALGTAAWDRYKVQRKAALRFLAIPLLFLGVHALMLHLHVPQKYVSLAMLLVIVPLYLFRELMKDVAYRSTAAGMVDLFELDKYDEDDKLTSITTDEFKKLLFEHFCLTGKKKQRKAAVDKFLTTNTGAKKPLMWLSVMFLAVVLVAVSGPFFGLIFALALACTILTTVRYFRAATPPLKRLGDITLQLGDNPNSESDEDTDDEQPKKKDGKKASAKKTTTSGSAGDDTDKSDKTDDTHGPSDEALLQMVTAYHNSTGNPQDNQFLNAFFGNKVPTVKEFKKLIAQAPDTTSGSAGDDTGTTALPPLPRRTKKTAAASQPGPTGTPPHGTPVASPAPAPAAATPTYTPTQLDELFNKWLALGDDGLTAEQNAAIAPYKKTAR